jgi:hypothetical protein
MYFATIKKKKMQMKNKRDGCGFTPFFLVLWIQEKKGTNGYNFCDFPRAGISFEGRAEGQGWKKRKKTLKNKS